MNDNKTWKVTIELAVVAPRDPLDDDGFYTRICHLDIYDSFPSIEGVILMGTESVELTARSSDSKTEPATEPVVEPAVLQLAPPAESTTHQGKGKGKRDWRIRAGTENSQLREFAYYSSDYRKMSKQMDVGTHTKRNKRDCVWLTEAEVAKVYAQVMEVRARRAARRAAKGGE